MITRREWESIPAKVVNFMNLRQRNLGRYISGQIEAPTWGAFAFCGGLEVDIIRRCEMLAKRGVNLVAGLRNSWADRRRDARSLGAQLLHLRDGVFQNTTLRAAPSGVRGPDDARLAIGKKHGRAVCGDDAQCQARLICNNSVCNGATFGHVIPSFGDADDVRRMDLVGRHNSRIR